MKWSELPKEYQDLERSNRKCEVNKMLDDIEDRFWWKTTPQGVEFWNKCRLAKTIKDLPPITITDYPDIKEPEKKKRYFIIFWASETQKGVTAIKTKGEYFTISSYHRKHPDRIPTNIIELNESDYNDFIA